MSAGVIITAADRAAGAAADDGAIAVARALSARDCGALQSEMREARKVYLAEAFAQHRTASQADLLEALAWFINDIDGTHTVMVEFDANVERARAAIAKARGEA
ncbi:hypothetical protein JMG10_13290 [Nostoc ellipsosporum NOK]|nr:hypothetical protein [Nostoc ellipsosporum NOK]